MAAFSKLGELEGLDKAEALQMDMNGVFQQIVTLLRKFTKLLPQSTDTLKFVKQETGEVSKIMDSIFKEFENKGPEIFGNVASLWKLIWTLYFLVLLPMSCGILYYGFWASGWFGGPKPIENAEEEGRPQALQTFSDRVMNCCTACCACAHGFHDTQVCFWSCMILFEVVCLLIFVVALVLCIIGGVQSFVVSGCAQVYLLKDEKVCLETVKALRKFVSTFIIGAADIPVEEMCPHHNLLTCELLAENMASSTMYISIFSFLGAVLSFQMIIESACLHTRAAFRRRIEADKDINEISSDSD
jgi:hypothetical protein